MSKTRKIRRARNALKREQAARRDAEFRAHQMVTATYGIQFAYDQLLEHASRVLGDTTVTSAILNGPKMIRNNSPVTEVDVMRPLPQRVLSYRHAEELSCRLERLEDLVVRHQEQFNKHLLCVRHGDNERALQVNPEALMTTPIDMLVQAIAGGITERPDRS